MQSFIKFNNTFFLIFIFFFISVYVHSQDLSNSCNSPLTLTSPLPFATSSLHCASVWSSEKYVLRYAQESSNVWNFILSTPNPNAFVGIGFSPNGNMIGSTAIVGWANADGTTVINKYFLRGQTPSLVELQPSNQGLKIGNSSAILESNQLYLAFQLIDTNPSTRLIYSVGPTGRIPTGPDYRLTQHRTMISTVLNYATGQFQTQSSPQASLKRSHGILNMLGWGILMPIGIMVARYMRRWDPLWFYSHAIIQSIAFSLGIIGVICGLVLENRLDISVNKHKTLGIIILIFGTLQVMAVLLRPDKASKIRKYWNWYHHNAGRVVIVLAAVNVFYGIHLANGGTNWNTGFAVVLVILFVISLILELRRCLKK
ncbi:cytochrome b561 and DOMON domain-containing protein At3g07570 [Andrographis paniculata]|uniref:cytochrome b561 and DOMON domain-containing protein At3g07570 n=1 Tax=Andrographis paniculata TaxID=175694 RepID=UPI0021E735E4|nr:cytochrome b561 and DOMON domain-containing protein At3g07570 [Andrographis paniculata]